MASWVTRLPVVEAGLKRLKKNRLVTAVTALTGAGPVSKNHGLSSRVNRPFRLTAR
jgi:hypothetical protein